MKTITDSKNIIKIWASDLELEAEKQIRNVASLPFIHQHVAVMADAHAGKGSTIGTVIATRDAIIPSAVGVDIGCGMCAVKMPFKIDQLGDNLNKIRSAIERSIPLGFNQHKEISTRMFTAFKQLGNIQAVLSDKLLEKAAYQIGTLGGGNHFIEICQDENNDAWVMLHSGSRNIGKELASIHIEKAKGLMKEYLIDLPDPDLAYLTQNTREFNAYLHDLHWAQRYAKANRNEMMLRVLKDISYHVYGEDKGTDFMTTQRVDCHHNYTNLENHFNQNIWVTRKGAVSARSGELGIIPGSMGTKSYIVRGKGNLESFCSCSHGAGRKMSRSKAKKTFSVHDLKQQTLGIECRKDKDILDEIPGAYKDIDEVMNNQADLVDIVHTLKQLICVKG
ncbi:MAG: RtcB family protein [Gammaproteobacteria bacterium]|jgi:tRNA-splicing ligase RtcB|nr:RtcB family protein [Gammaproteobacteria bacterium]